MSTYLLVNLAAISIPLVFSFHPRFPFVNHWSSFSKACITTAIPFLIWDAIFTRLGIWGFNKKHTGSIDFIGMPIEEYLFFLCIPYACVFTFFSLETLIGGWIQSKIKSNATRWVFGPLGIVLVVMGLLFSNLLYSSVTFLSMGIFSLILFIKNPSHLFLMLLTYLLTLIPFFAVNGVLTGSWISEEVVWYNNSENLSIRMGSIPIEDAFYGMLLIMMNISLFTYFRDRASTLR